MSPYINGSLSFVHIVQPWNACDKNCQSSAVCPPDFPPLSPNHNKNWNNGMFLKTIYFKICVFLMFNKGHFSSFKQSNRILWNSKTNTKYPVVHFTVQAVMAFSRLLHVSVGLLVKAFPLVPKWEDGSRVKGNVCVGQCQSVCHKDLRGPNTDSWAFYCIKQL